MFLISFVRARSLLLMFSLQIAILQITFFFWKKNKYHFLPGQVRPSRTWSRNIHFFSHLTIGFFYHGTFQSCRNQRFFHYDTFQPCWNRQFCARQIPAMLKLSILIMSNFNNCWNWLFWPRHRHIPATLKLPYFLPRHIPSPAKTDVFDQDPSRHHAENDLFFTTKDTCEIHMWHAFEINILMLSMTCIAICDTWWWLVTKSEIWSQCMSNCRSF